MLLHLQLSLARHSLQSLAAPPSQHGETRKCQAHVALLLSTAQNLV